MKHFYELTDLPQELISELLRLSDRLRDSPEPRALAGRVMGIVQLSPSLRTTVSFEAAMVRLGGGTFLISPERTRYGLTSAHGIVMDGTAAEHLGDVLPVLATYADLLGIRLFAELRDLNKDLSDARYFEMASSVNKPLINLESAARHPCQSLADWKTLDESATPGNRGKLVLSWAYHPNPLPLSRPISTLYMAAMRGMDVVVLRPEGFTLPPAVLSRANQLAKAGGGSVNETNDRRSAMEGADFVYMQEWASPEVYGDSVADTNLRNRYEAWCLDESWFATAAPTCKAMHAMPVRRGVSIADHVLDGPRSLLTKQAGNRMWTQMALVYFMLRCAA
jgi:N-acetylornithine carbamoyltransferase